MNLFLHSVTSVWSYAGFLLPGQNTGYKQLGGGGMRYFASHFVRFQPTGSLLPGCGLETKLKHEARAWWRKQAV